MSTNELHVVPIGDLIEHLPSDDCPCGPEARPEVLDDGSMGWLQVHHSLDNREAAERADAEGSAT